HAPHRRRHDRRVDPSYDRCHRTTATGGRPVIADTDSSAESVNRRLSPGQLLSRLVQSENTFLAVILVGLLIAFTLLTPSGTFLSVLNFKNMALDTSEIVVLAAGMTFVIIAAGIDLSIGSVVVFASVGFAEVMTHIAGTAGVFGGQAHHLPLAIALGVAVSLACGLFWGAFNGYLIGYGG